MVSHSNAELDLSKTGLGIIKRKKNSIKATIYGQFGYNTELMVNEDSVKVLRHANI